MDFISLAGLFLAAMLAGGLNAIAGGGSLISFPVLIAFGVLAVPANVTNTAALIPGSLGSVLGFWEEVKSQKRLLTLLVIPSLVGGLLGAYILISTPEQIFRQVVPYLILFATLLFAGSDWLARFNQKRFGVENITLARGAGGVLLQTAIATYGGYFGAGQGIMTMSALSVMGLRDIHRINGLKTVLALSVNGIALMYFAQRGIVIWPLAIWMGVGAIIGGYVAARISKKIDQQMLRVFVVFVGLSVSMWLFVK